MRADRGTPAVATRFTGPAGLLDARVHGPPEGHAVLLLHPHPRWGGTMGSRLVYDLATALGDAGWRAVRFDFRGVGRSEGSYGEGLGESEDAAAVFDALAAEQGSSPILVGYSFGGAVACRLATMRHPRALVLVATPLRLTESRLEPVKDAPAVKAPTHLVLGDKDGFVTAKDAEALAQAFMPPAKVTVLPGAAHFLEPSHNARAIEAVLAAFVGLEPPRHQ